MLEDADDLAGFFETEDGFAVAAVYRAGGVGAGVNVALIPSRGDETVPVFGVRSVSPSDVFLIQVAQAPALKAGDTMEIGGITHFVQGKPVRDESRGLWSFEAPAED